MRTSALRPHLAAQVLLLSLTVACACDATKVASECVAADLIGQCPVGSNPVLGAAAETACGGSFETKLVTDGDAATGQCGASGSCEFLCQFEVPCTCGVATLTKESIVCSECPDQSCGDGRCEGTERATCAPGQAGCFACGEDCAGPTCGDGDCTGDESPDTCPQDCAAVCEPNASVCIGTRVSKCTADGRSSVEFDCATGGLVCSGGECVASGVCGNGLCDGGESPASCAEDCSTLCPPSSRSCEGDTLVVCAADGQSTNRTDCRADAKICVNGQCREPNVCGNGLCEAGESEGCPADCAAVCGNRVCENNEATTCPADCTVCGDATCGAGEIESCPQDCGVCVPSEKECIARTLRVCNANGTAYEDIACDALGLTCGRGDCVEAGVCGNGLCEGDESRATCMGDCAEVCGDGVCAGAEVFLTCAVDCDPVCGDGTCEGDESHATCSFDCLASCGDGACAAPEDRANCPRDCGSCGDGVCQDGFESASLNPPGALESCVADCVVTGCDADGDCDDDVDCTTNQCLNGSCIYAPDDDRCTGTDKCIRFNGCCPDGDGDGYADIACGGSDCDDRDPDVHPGAVEVCGGGDKNCDGQHRPALLPAKRLTNTAAAKSDMTAMDLGDAVLLGWTGRPALGRHPQLLEVGWDLLPRGSVVTQDEIEVLDRTPAIAMAWNATRNRVGMWWVGTDYQAGVAWLGKDGALEVAPASLGTADCFNHSVGGTFNLYRHAAGAFATGDAVLFFSNLHPSNEGFDRQGYFVAGGVWRLAPTGNVALVTPDPGCAWVGAWYVDTGMVRPSLTAGLISGAGTGRPDLVEPPAGGITSFDPTDTVLPLHAQLDHPSAAANTCAMGSDGELLAVACASDDTLHYHRATQAGGVFYSAEILTGTYEPVAVGTSKPGLGASPVVGVAVRDGGGSLWFFARDQAGEEVLEPAIIGGGEAVRSTWVLHDGHDFIVVWLAKSGGFEQAFGQRIICE